ncbi:hypothetical protein EDC96DRAFT_525262 [Choanephora cucurbitarum]|nr:hypothetical protein EDC96DRAFT_525262 [Choanephora cucurbitarum]
MIRYFAALFFLFTAVLAQSVTSSDQPTSIVSSTDSVASSTTALAVASSTASVVASSTASAIASSTASVVASVISSSVVPTPTPTVSPKVSTNGFDDQNVNQTPQQESWLRQHDRYVFIIVIALFVVAILIWYIVRSIRGMRTRLAEENRNQMTMVQNISGGGHGFSETIPVDNNGFQKMPEYPGTPQQQQPYSHRY